MGAPTSWWEEIYRTSDVSDLPWYTPALDSDFDIALTTRLPAGGRVLDLGTGPATQAIALARRGYVVIATDIAPSAIAKARRAAQREAVRIDFRVDDILESKLPDAVVDAIMDRGVFHTLPPESRPAYVTTVRRILRPNGYLFLKVFSDEEPRQQGPYHFSPAELRGYFDASFDVLSLEAAAFRGTLRNAPKALMASLRRR